MRPTTKLADRRELITTHANRLLYKELYQHEYNLLSLRDSMTVLDAAGDPTGTNCLKQNPLLDAYRL